MKKIAMIVLAVIVAACAPPSAFLPTMVPVSTPAPSIRSDDVEITRHIDEEAGVVCWLSRVAGGYDISCLPMSQTNLVP